MFTKRLVVEMFAIAAMVLSAGVVSGQDYPNRPIRIIATAIGGAPDGAARLTAPLMSEGLGQQVIIDNRQSVVYGGQVVAKASPDGYTLLLPGSSMWTGSVFSRLPFDPQKDFKPVSMIGNAILILVVYPKGPINSVKELIAYAKAKPGVLNMASGTVSSSGSVAGLLFKSMAGVDIVNINYKGIPPGLNDLMAGQVHLAFPSSGAGLHLVTQGRLKALATTGAVRSAMLPDVPTVAEAGLPGYEFSTSNGLFAPPRTPDAIIKRLNQEIVRGLRRPDAKEKFLRIGQEAVGSTPEYLAASIKSEIAKISRLFKEYPDIRPND